MVFRAAPRPATQSTFVDGFCLVTFISQGRLPLSKGGILREALSIAAPENEERPYGAS